MEEFALRFLVSGMWGLNPEEAHVRSVLRSISWAYLTYIGVILTTSVIVVWRIRKTQNRYLRTALITLFYIGVLFSPFVFFTLENAYRPPKAQMEVYVHVRTIPILAVSVIALAGSIIWLQHGRSAKQSIKSIAM